MTTTEETNRQSSMYKEYKMADSAFQKISIADSTGEDASAVASDADLERVEQEEMSATSNLAIYSDNVDLDSADIVWPRLRLAQGLSPEVQAGTAKPGQWVIVGEDPADSLTVVPMLFAKRRERTDADFNKLCSSQDAKTGVGDPGGSCASCSMAQFTGPKNARKAPECSLVYSYLVYIVEYGQMAMLEFKRTSANTGKLLNTIVAQRGLQKVAVVLDRKQQSGRMGSYWVPTVRAIKPEPEVLEAAAAALG